MVRFVNLVPMGLKRCSNSVLIPSGLSSITVMMSRDSRSCNTSIFST
nr:MAG TPA: hypothetical protein [Caudoviricetes sp.]